LSRLPATPPPQQAEAKKTIERALIALRSLCDE
jgi:hypothetical protein